MWQNSRPSGIVTKILKSLGEAGAPVLDLVDITSDSCIPSDWQQSFIVHRNKGKRHTMNRGNKCLMLIEQVIKVSEHKEKRSENDEMHCYFVSGCGSAVFFIS